jgi:uncharacterized protein (DUF427 family)
MSKKMQDLMAAARGLLRHQPIERRVRASLEGRPVADSNRALLVWEPRRICPAYAVPAEDLLAAPAPAPAADDDVPGLLHPGIPFGVHSAEGEALTVAGRAGAGFRLADDDLDGYVVLDFDAFDWLEEDEPIAGHPRDPYHRVDVRRSLRTVRIELDGELLAETAGARLLCETNLPMRFYVPRDDVRAELRRSDSRSYCPYKGEAIWWSLEGHEDLGWTYEQPFPEVAAIAGLVAFWDELVDVYVDGEPREQPRSVFSEVLLEEFGA